MKRRVMTIIIGIVVIVVLVLVGWYVMFVHFGKGPAFPVLPTKKIEMDVEGGEIAENQLVGIVDTEEQAQEIAEQYGITLVSYEYGIAVYHTQENPLEVISRGQESGYPALSLNYVQTIYENGQTQK